MLKTTTTEKSFKKLLLTIASIALLISMIGIFPLITTSNLGAASTQLSIYTTLTPAQVYELIKSDSSIILLDTRVYGEYTGELSPFFGHITGALSLVDDETLIVNLSRFPDKTKPYISYCDVPECSHAQNVATTMYNLGYTNITYMPEGVAGWNAAVYPFSKGTDPGIITPVEPSFTISASVTGTGGAISPSGDVAVNSGANQTFTITPAAGYRIGSLILDGESKTAAPTYIFTNVVANHTISAIFVSLPTFTITAAVSGAGGTISPSGNVVVNSGANQNFTITPAVGYRIGTLTVDGGSITAAPTYTFTNVVDNHTISATFASIPTFSITASVSGSGGAISPSGDVVVNSGANQTFIITPAANYIVDTLTVDKKKITAATTYTFTNVVSNHTISATFVRLPTFTITASVTGTGGAISPSGNVTVNSGVNQTFTITPAAGYRIGTLTVDGGAKTTATTYTFTNVVANHTISATFASFPKFTINASVSGSGGAISPSGDVAVNSGDNQTFTITPAAGYRIGSLTVDKKAITAATTYTFNNVAENHTISAAFVNFPTFTIDASVTGGLGSVSPSTQTIEAGSNATITITPDNGYHIAGLTDNGIPVSGVAIVSPYVISNLSANHAVAVTFSNTYLISATTGTGGTISPSGDVAVNPNASQIFTIEAASGYHITDVVIDSLSQGATSSYTFTDVTANHTIAASFAVDYNAGSGGSSSGGGGGGGSTYTPPPGYTNLDGFIGFEGTVLKDAAAVSADKKVVFFIEKGIKFLTASGYAVSGVTIVPRADKPAPPEGSNIIGLCYKFGPTGSTFSQAATLTISYAGYDLANFNEKNLATAYWDDQANKWIKLSGCLVDTTNQTVTSQITHFSTYANLAYPAPATFTISDLVIEPKSVEAGKDVNVTIRVANTGESRGSYTAVLMVGDTAEATREVTLNKGEKQQVSFTVKREQVGTYTFYIDKLSGSFVYLRPAEYIVTNLELSPPNVEAGQDLTVSFQVLNSGEVSGIYTATVLIGGIIEATKDIALDKGESQKVIFVVKRDQPGTYSVGVEDLLGSFISFVPAGFTVRQPGNNNSAYAAALTPSYPFRVWWLLAALVAVLVGVVLLALLIGRRRSR